MPYGIQRHTTILFMYVLGMFEESFILIPTNIVGKCLYEKIIFCHCICM